EPTRAEQHAYTLSIEFAHDVPERDVDGGDGLNRRPTASIVNAAAVHLVPEPFGLKWVFPDHQGTETFEELHSRLAPGRRFHCGLSDGSRGLHIGVAGDPGASRD